MASPKGRAPKVVAEDTIAWWWVTRDVTPLPGRTKPPPPEAVAKAAVAEPAKPSKPERTPTSATHRPALAPGEAAGLDRASLRRLVRGKFAIEDTLDLHGHTRVEAHAALASFVATRAASRRACVLIVTGRGRGDTPGVLKELVPRWLNEPANRGRILGFATALPRHGGSGAIYVLLRKRG